MCPIIILAYSMEKFLGCRARRKNLKKSKKSCQVEDLKKLKHLSWQGEILTESYRDLYLYLLLSTDVYI
jgi:hypothetical protein